MILCLIQSEARWESALDTALTAAAFGQSTAVVTVSQYPLTSALDTKLNMLVDLSVPCYTSKVLSGPETCVAYFTLTSSNKLSELMRNATTILGFQ